MWDWEGGIATEPRALDTIAAFTVGPLVSGRVSGDGAVVGPTSGYRPLWDRGFLLHRQGTGGESGSHLCTVTLQALIHALLQPFTIVSRYNRCIMHCIPNICICVCIVTLLQRL